MMKIVALELINKFDAGHAGLAFALLVVTAIAFLLFRVVLRVTKYLPGIQAQMNRIVDICIETAKISQSTKEEVIRKG